MSATARFGALLLFTCLVHQDVAAETNWAGRPLRDAIAALSRQGLRILYSDELVREDYRVRAEPASQEPAEILKSVLAPFGLTVASGPAGSLLVVRDVQAAARQAAPTAPSVEEPPLEEIVVTSSLYNLRYQTPAAHTFLERELTAALPDLGDEPVRALWRLPGTASGGVSTRPHVRGGLRNEQLFLLDGLRLYEPYHLKDFHQIATTIDQNAIAGIDFYAAGYPARYGDRMSGVVDMALREPPPPDELVTELGLSVFNFSLLSMGRFGGNGRGDWMLSARRGNLDLIANVVDPAYGSPRYEDVMSRVGWDWSDRTHLSANMLYSFDRITISERDASESARAKYRNSVIWLKAQTDWSDTLSSETIVSMTDVANQRSGQKYVPDMIAGTVDDQRDFSALALSQHWAWDLSDTLQLSAGADVKELEAEYRYDMLRTIEAPFDTLFDNEAQTVRRFEVAPSGAQYAVFTQVRWRPFDRLVLDAGLRWDQQTYTTADDDEQVSPRINVLYRVGERTDLRFATGQFYQAQEINELQVSDGLAAFFPAQRASHVVASLAHRFPSGIEVRLEGYRKKYNRLMPRFENVFDSLVLIPELQVDRLRIDADNALATGLELTVSGKRNDLLWWASYSWSEVEEDVAGMNLERSWDQTHTLKGGMNWNWNHWNFSAAGIVNTGWPATTMSGETVTAADGSRTLALTVVPRNSLRYETFHSLDVRASRHFDVPRGELDAFLEISNLYNHDNQCCTAYRPATGDDGAPILAAKEGSWLPLVPSVGVQWRF